MIRLPHVTLPDETQEMLDGLQRTVNGGGDYLNRVAVGKNLFDVKRKTSAFHPLRSALGQMCSGARRCCYCEDSAATDIEHIRPKDFYPDLVFVWDNYLYACPRCNRPKSNICDIYSHVTDLRISVPKQIRQQGGPPESGDCLLINPRLENPLDFLFLDLKDTFFFVPRGRQGSREWERADHTIRLLKLNEEDVLPVARAEAYNSYLDRLEKYIDRKSKNRPADFLERIVSSLKRMGHPTVWQEMKRQASLIPPLEELFVSAPEAYTW